jgi:hypothetical protein
MLVGVALALTVLGGLCRPAAAAAGAQGEEVEVTGRVTDPTGRALPGIAIQLKASHSTLSLRRMSRLETHPTYVQTVTDKRGDFHFTWKQHEFYDQFSIAAGLKVAADAGGFEEIQRVDLTDRFRLPGAAGGVVVPIEVERTPRVDRYVAFVESITSDDQQRVFEQLGQPEKTDRLQLAGQEEVTWWYFRRGKAYRFESGRLELVIPFEPVGS